MYLLGTWKQMLRELIDCALMGLVLAIMFYGFWYLTFGLLVWATVGASMWKAFFILWGTTTCGCVVEKVVRH